MKKAVLFIILIGVSLITFAQKAKSENKKTHTHKVSPTKTPKQKPIEEFTQNLVAYTAINDDNPIGENSTECEHLKDKYGIRFRCVKFTPISQKCVFSFINENGKSQPAEIGVGKDMSFFSYTQKLYISAKYIKCIPNPNYPLGSKTTIRFSIYNN